MKTLLADFLESLALEIDEKYDDEHQVEYTAKADGETLTIILYNELGEGDRRFVGRFHEID